MLELLAAKAARAVLRGPGRRDALRLPDHHDIAVTGPDGTLLARRRITDDAAGLAQLVELLAEHGDSLDDPIAVAIETRAGC